MLIEIFNKTRHNPEAVREILTLAMGNPIPEKLDELIGNYFTHDNRRLYIASRNNEIIGVIGIDLNGKPKGIIMHLAVMPDMRKQGIGRKLIEHIIKTISLTELEAETDQDAVEFYVKCGFDTKEIESPYPGVRRFRCFRNMIE